MPPQLMGTSGLPARSPDIREERKGPRVDAPEAAIKGFLKAAGLASVDKAEKRDDKKGAYYVAVIEKPGRATSEVVAGIVPERIVNVLEAVQVEERHAHQSSVTFGLDHGLAQTVGEQDAIRQSGQAVIVRESPQLFLGVPTFADIQLYAEHAGRPTGGVAQDGRPHAQLQRRAILGTAGEFPARQRAGAQRQQPRPVPRQ